MNILIVGFSKIKYMPYANFYINSLDRIKNNVHFVYWNRDQKPENTAHLSNVVLHEFSCYQKDQVSKKSKIFNFVRFYKFTKDVIKSEKIDFVIVMQSTTAVTMSITLLKKFKYNYIFDYRDSSYEYNKIYKHIICMIERFSKYTFVSSDGFRRYFPLEDQHKIITSHNIVMDDLEHRYIERDSTKFKDSLIKVSFWGLVRDLEINMKVINQLGNDARFELHYFGKEEYVANCLKDYAKSQNFINVFFHGEYNLEDRYEFAKTTDIIHNIYDNENAQIAMTNKFYDGLIFRIPQIVNCGDCIMGEKVTQFGVGVVLSPYDEDFCNKLYDYYMNLNRVKFEKSCDDALNQILLEYEKGCKIIEFL